MTHGPRIGAGRSGQSPIATRMGHAPIDHQGVTHHVVAGCAGQVNGGGGHVLVAANALGRFLGTLLSGLLYQWGGLLYALLGSAAMLGLCWLMTLNLPMQRQPDASAT